MPTAEELTKKPHPILHGVGSDDGFAVASVCSPMSFILFSRIVLVELVSRLQMQMPVVPQGCVRSEALFEMISSLT